MLLLPLLSHFSLILPIIYCNLSVDCKFYIDSSHYLFLPLSFSHCCVYMVRKENDKMNAIWMRMSFCSSRVNDDDSKVAMMVATVAVACAAVLNFTM